MNNMVMKYATSNIGKELASIANRGGKSSWIIVAVPIGMYLMYALCNDVMDKDCVLDLKANADGIELKLSKRETIN